MTTSQKPSENSPAEAADEKALAQRTIKLLDDAKSKLGAFATPSTVVDRRRVLRFRKGAEGIIPKLGTLIQSAGLDGRAISVDDMLANLERGQALEPLQQHLEALANWVGAIVFGARTASWQTAMHGYASLQRMALNDPALAESLQPVADFMAYRHPSTAEGEPTKGAKRASAKLQKAQKQMSKRAERAEAALAHATASLAAATTDGAVAEPAAAPAAPRAPVTTP